MNLIDDFAFFCNLMFVFCFHFIDVCASRGLGARHGARNDRDGSGVVPLVTAACASGEKLHVCQGRIVEAPGRSSTAAVS